MDEHLLNFSRQMPGDYVQSPLFIFICPKYILILNLGFKKGQLMQTQKATFPQEVI